MVWSGSASAAFASMWRRGEAITAEAFISQQSTVSLMAHGECIFEVLTLTGF